MENNNPSQPSPQPLPSEQKREQLHSVSSPTSHSPSKTFIILIVVILIAAVGVGGYFLGIRSNKPLPDVNSVVPSPPSATQGVSPTTSQKMSPPPDIKSEITTTQLKSIPISSTTSWKEVSFKGISFKIRPDLIFKDLQDSSNIGIIYKEGEAGGPLVNIRVQDYKGGSRRQEYFGDNYYDCHYIYEEALFGNVKALQIAADFSWCQGGYVGGIVAVIGDMLVSVGPGLQYNLDTKEIIRYSLRDTIVSTLKPIK